MAGRDPVPRTPAALRRFGLELGGALTVLAAVSWWRGHTVPPAVMAAAGGVLLATALAAPAVLAPVARAWLGLAERLARVVNPVVMGLAYFALITPIAILVRMRRDPLDRAMHDGRPSTWIRRERKPVDPARYRHQF